MTQKERYSVVDVGNTQLKIADFLDDELVKVTVIPRKNTSKIKDELIQRQAIISILSSVSSLEDRKEIESFLQPNVVLNHETPLPVSIDDYHTPHTLGVDRIANVVAADYFSTTENALVIDAGTCITIEFISKGRFQGGSISPGYRMRLKAMHEFTGGLPSLELEEFDKFVGRSTKEAMLSGVRNGIQQEINGFIAHYTKEYDPLTIFLTGGDHKLFDLPFKNSIFADDNFTLKGLFLILKHNV